MTLTVTALTGAPAGAGPAGTHGGAGDAGFSSALDAAMGEHSAARPGPGEAAPERPGHRVGRHGRGGDAADRACGDPAPDGAQSGAVAAAPAEGSHSGAVASGTAEGTAAAPGLQPDATACPPAGASAPAGPAALLTGATPAAAAGQAGASGGAQPQLPLAGAASAASGAAVLAGTGTGEPGSASPRAGVADAGTAVRTAAMLPTAQPGSPAGIPALEASTAPAAASALDGQRGAVLTAAGGTAAGGTAAAVGSSAAPAPAPALAPAPAGQPSGPGGAVVVAAAGSALTAPGDAAGSPSAPPAAGAAGDGIRTASSAAPGAESAGGPGDAFGTALPASGAAPVSAPMPAAAPQSAAAASAAPAPALPAQLHAPIARITALGPGEHSITVRLAPESLGPVTVRAHVDLHGVRVELIAAGAAGHDALKAILPELRRDLAHAGLGSSLQLLSGDPGSRGSDGQQLGSSGGPFSDGPLGTDDRERRAAEPGDEPGRRGGAVALSAVEAQAGTGLLSPETGIDLLA